MHNLPTLGTIIESNVCKEVYLLFQDIKSIYIDRKLEEHSVAYVPLILVVCPKLVIVGRPPQGYQLPDFSKTLKDLLQQKV